MHLAKPRTALTLACSAVAFLTPLSAEAEVVTVTYQNQPESGLYNGTSDTWLEGANPTTNHGTEASLRAYGSGIQETSLLRFDDVFGDNEGQVPEHAVITSATVRLWITNASIHSDVPDRNNLLVHRMLTDWENDAAVHHYHAYDDGPVSYWGENDEATEGPVADVDYAVADHATVPFTDDTEYWIDIDVTAWVQGWHDGTLDNYGMYLFASGEYQGVRYHGSDQYWDDTRVNTRPTLEVTYIPEPASLGLLGALGAPLLLSRRGRTR